jgi:ketosteroid isomerase-like protein
MSNIFKAILIPACVLVVWAVQSEGLPSENDKNVVSPKQQKVIEQEILKVHAEMVKAAENSDPEGLFSHVIDGCKGVIVQDGIITTTRQEALDATKQGLQGLTDISYKFNRKNITVISPATAIWVADGTTSVTTVNDGRQLNFQFAETIIFTLKDGQWKVFHAHRSVPNPR